MKKFKRAYRFTKEEITEVIRKHLDDTSFMLINNGAYYEATSNTADYDAYDVDQILGEILKEEWCENFVSTEMNYDKKEMEMIVLVHYKKDLRDLEKE